WLQFRPREDRFDLGPNLEGRSTSTRFSSCSRRGMLGLMQLGLNYPAFSVLVLVNSTPRDWQLQSGNEAKPANSATTSLSTLITRSPMRHNFVRQQHLDSAVCGERLHGARKNWYRCTRIISRSPRMLWRWLVSG